jgi:hypothetical protein
MKFLVVALISSLSLNAWAEKDSEIDSTSQIQSFLNSPGVQNFNYPDPKNWKSYRKYIQIGTRMPDGSCQYHYESTVPSNQPFIQKEIAVDRVGCRSLMLEGVPDDATLNQWKQIQQVIHKGSKQQEPNGQNAGRKITIQRNSTSGSQLLINQNTPAAGSGPTDTQAASTSATDNGGTFNTGGTTYMPSYDIQYTDGNNPVMKQGLVGIVTGLADLLKLLGLQIGSDGILAAEVGISQTYGTPAVAPVSGNCYYDNLSNGSSVNFTEYGSSITYQAGSVGWTQKTQNACEAMLFSTGSTVNHLAYSSEAPGQSPIAPGSAACVSAANASFNNSCAAYGQQIPYVAFGYYANASGSFYNNSKLSFLGQTIFDCSAEPGLTITFSDMKIISDGIGHSTITGNSNVNGPQANCASYLSANITYLPNAKASAN